MVFRVEVTESAKRQIEESYQWYRRNIPLIADSWLEGLFQALETLKRFPNRCQLAPENNEFHEDVRQLLYGKRKSAYRILFAVRDETVYVLHVRHHAEARLTAEDIYGEDQSENYPL